jgi:hypothetical protein
MTDTAIMSGPRIQELARAFINAKAKKLGDLTFNDMAHLLEMLEECLLHAQATTGVEPVRYRFDMDYPEGTEDFIGLYPNKNGGPLVPKIIKRSNHPQGVLKFTTEQGGPPHYITAPIGWALLPKTEHPTPIERKVSMFKLTPDMELRLEHQKDEFDSLDELVKAFKALPAIVDDDYPRARHVYDGALRTFLRACMANGRLEYIK